MSLSCMELQLDQWLLTKGRSSAGRPLPCSLGAHFLEWAGAGDRVTPGAHFLGHFIRPGKTQVSEKWLGPTGATRLLVTWDEGRGISVSSVHHWTLCVSADTLSSVCLVRATSPGASASLLGPLGSDAGHLGPWGSAGSGPRRAGGHLGPAHEVDSFRPDGFQCLLGTAPQAC